MSDKTAGQRAYEAYRATPGTYAPEQWGSLANTQRRGWHNVAAAVMPPRNDGMTDDERDVWKATYASARVAGNDHAFSLKMADTAVTNLRHVCPVWFEVTKP